MRYQNDYFHTLYQNYTMWLFFVGTIAINSFFFQNAITFSAELNISANMKSKIVKVNGKRRWMHLNLWRICCYYLDLIDHLFGLRNCFYFLFAIIFSAQFTVILVKRENFNKNLLFTKGYFLNFVIFFPGERFCPLKFLLIK